MHKSLPPPKCGMWVEWVKVSPELILEKQQVNSEDVATVEISCQKVDYTQIACLE